VHAALSMPASEAQQLPSKRSKVPFRPLNADGDAAARRLYQKAL